MRDVTGQRDEPEGSVPVAIRPTTGEILSGLYGIAGPSQSISDEILTNGWPGFVPTGSVSVGTRPTFDPSAPPSKDLIKHWRKPKDARAFAAQANEVATMVLNNEIDIDKARAYSGVARTMAQVLSAEVYRARYLQQAPNLSLEEDV